jgi:hypothetical protein
MSYDAPWDIVKGHRNLSTPKSDRWKAELEARAARFKYFGYAPNWVLYPKTSTLMIKMDFIYQQRAVFMLCFREQKKEKEEEEEKP